jgi:carotenoid cleavage dioxygenase-like enzyme
MRFFPPPSSVSLYILVLPICPYSPSRLTQYYWQVGRSSYRHWFDGLAMLYSFTIQEGGTISFTSRFLKSESHERAMACNRIVISEFGTFHDPDPCKSIFSRFFSYFSRNPDQTGPTDNGNVNLAKIGERFFAFTETPVLTEFDGTTLETLGRVKVSSVSYCFFFSLLFFLF